MNVPVEPSDNPELKPVPGPSALGGGWKRFLDLLWLISVNDFKKTYFGTVLGYVWSLARPLMLFAVLLFVFTKVFRVGSDTPHYPVLLLFNIVMITFVQEATLASVVSVVNQEGIVRKTHFPRLVIPLSVVMTSLFNFGTNLIIVVVFVIAFGVPITWTWLLFPVIVLLLFVFTLALSTLLSALYPRFRDIGIIWSVLVTALFYATPVLYPMNIVPDRYVDIVMANPLAPIFQQARHWVIDPSAPTAAAAAGGWVHLLPAIAIFIGLCVISVLVFRREAPRIAEEL
ncbi:MAG: ABC transporter permease [Solirubrobacterales bacterium]|nr:ABC transporter permease [Solirubrobacterales bacterium]